MSKAMCALLAACCTVAAVSAAEPVSNHWGQGGDPRLFQKDAFAYGKSISGWADRSVQWMYAQPFDHNPFFDATGANCAVDQHGPVWFLAPIASMAPGNYTRACTIPHDKAILLMAMDLSDTYPCPDPNFKPQPGQSLYDFLVADSKTYPTAAALTIKLDGRPVRDALSYRYISENLFSLKGDLSLQAPFDPCITGDWQPAVSNGVFFLFRPLSRGQHVLVRSSTGPTGNVNTFTYYLTIE
ncbi:hypothetical protein FCE95_04295 [Luteimonas gilva]|uniref:Uncharacterized protein n=1 Tax=Luteimonas gilva TaxID=2572684 RepID=A0A4U5JUI4_9GAMM|nr:hypothetical protein [Luteimonas gilva]TKR33524.1 hypothetical protein FCE95_04295 [Luteimonas gilva]